ncbi:sulfite exporter TauE/SafE family protein [Zunongwangia endophytica]|uniref:Sulfite exporter TauE/SafE family protein n=1 Tax=Zunongwangia endophytica TaxID=1808945 RepID=A0ABV8H7M1_9FLAO|nr:sulfite exporter TauE/SafE family protein [Zunongwangia endophytica]MDN3593706.1 sulfite exporter TauE/SafE family protein [Zunongwangia endophytica]
MFFSAFLFGLLGSFHCIGMCGPIAFLLPLSRDKKPLMFFQLFLYHFGRILSYAAIGSLFGLLGKGLNLFAAQQKLSIGIGILMILTVIISFGSMKLNKIGTPFFRIISRLKSKIGAGLKKKSPDTFLSIGMLNGFLPCGLVYMAMLGAIAEANAGFGALYMVFFGVGTIPLMTAAVVLSSKLSGSIKTRERIRKLIPIFVVLTGLLFILRGSGLNIPYLSPAVAKDKVDAKIECHEPSLFSVKL